MGPTDKDYDEKIKKRYESGIRNFTDGDLKRILLKETKARSKAKNLKGFFDEFILAFELLKDFKKGVYPAPWKLIAAIGFAVAYLLSPIDLMPDFIPVLGFVDDASVFALVLGAFKSEIDSYKIWKNGELNEEKGEKDENN